ncbi:MAG: polysaccharide deacetylase family protein [Bacteroidetes bacterium]|nr:polysaccharide deacetylase family protein [Bacteroidota bacterium]
MNAVRPPFFFRILSPEYLLCSVPTQEKVLYLTFDDGPVPGITPEVLRILQERNVMATFFVVGENVKKHPDVFRLIIAAGHAVGNHTFHHLNGWKTPPAMYVEDVMRCNEYLTTKLFRPPYGRFTPSQYYLLRKQYRFILWSVLSGDYNRKITPEQCLSNVLENSVPGSIIVFHDSLKAKDKLLYALPRFLDHFLGEGYRFERLSDSEIAKSEMFKS